MRIQKYKYIEDRVLFKCKGLGFGKDISLKAIEKSVSFASQTINADKHTSCLYKQLSW